jgi:ATP-binding cassette subfamily B protein
VPAPAFAGRVEFDHVSFAYEWGRPALVDVSFDVPAGSRVSVIGPSGSGKSTLVSLLMRLFEPTSGTVRIDGHDAAGYTAGSVRQQCSVVLQDTVLFAGTVRENLLCGLGDIPEAEMVDAARLADAHDFIMRLPDGYDSRVGERGVTFSAGQRQRLAIARAALRRTPLVVLDEPTTGLDDVSKAQVLAALDRLGRGRTTFFITHEVALTRRRTDLVVWIDQGRIVEAGHPDDLVAAGGRYASALSEAARLTAEAHDHAVAG